MTYKAALTSLGCSKNLVDSEIMLGLLKEHDYEITDDYSSADAIIVNTCGFILSAKEESIETILTLAGYKKTGKCKALIAAGCLVEKYRDELAVEIPEVDGFLGSGEFHNIVSLLDSKLKSQPYLASNCSEDIFRFRFLTTPNYTAYVKIAEGCDNHCTYCLIPQMRGSLKSRPMESVQEEVRQLVSQGVKEINLIAQDTTSYGVDIYGQEMLPELLDILSGEGAAWIRLFYCYPARITPRLIDVIAKHENICRYLDIPIQHSDDMILKRMGRKETRDQLLRLFHDLREKIPGLVIRTTCMVGFPGETEKNFQSLLDFLSEVKFDWLGAFTYSCEDDTPAAKMPDQVPEEIKQIRFDRLMALQSEISQKNKKNLVGKTISVLVEGKSLDNPEYFIGRSQFHAPEVDGIVLIKGRGLKIGEFVPVLITESDIYDIIGEIKAK